ncbi:MAG: bifunctional nuclease family protein, partial [Candidatus Limnocylindria bacterium]
MQQMQIYGVSFDMVGKQPIVLLKTVDGNRFLPIWIGHPEAAAILMKLQVAQAPRPMNNDLLNYQHEQVEAKCERVSVTELRDNT